MGAQDSHKVAQATREAEEMKIEGARAMEWRIIQEAIRQATEANKK